MVIMCDTYSARCNNHHRIDGLDDVNSAELIVADNRRKDRRDDRQEDRDDKQDCRQEEGRIGNDKRECKQENRGEDDEAEGDKDVEADA